MLSYFLSAAAAILGEFIHHIPEKDSL